MCDPHQVCCASAQRACDGFCFSNATRDCAGTCKGNATVDSCGVCNGSGNCDDSSTTSIVIIAGVLGACLVFLLLAGLRQRTTSVTAVSIGARAAPRYVSAFARHDVNKLA